MTRTADDLARVLRRIDGRGYPAYRDVRGSWRLPGFELDVRRVQGDPYAAPTRVAALLDPSEAGFPAELLTSPSRRIGLSCLLARRFAALARRIQGGGRGGRDGGGRRGAENGRNAGSGRSGEIAMADPGQVVLANTAVTVDAEGAVEARFTVGLPARGRRVMGREAERLLLEATPRLVESALTCAAHDPAAVALHAETNEDAAALREQLAEQGLASFVADGAVLPRRSGVDDRPLATERAVPFESPPSFRVVLERPNGPPVSGMGVPQGVTLLVGGGYHGKSTVLDAIARGVYNHRPGDGREQVVTDATAVKLQAEDGRPVAGVDISPFIGALPGEQDTTRFFTANASGSTSQAAATVEALEAGTRLLLVDEDTAATNFMIRDRRMQALVRGNDEPITPFIDRVRSLYEDRGVGTVLVVGGSGDYLDVADHVVGMIRYRPQDLTAEAREVAAAHPTGRQAAQGPVGWPSRRRCPDAASVRPERGRRERYVKVRDRRAVVFGAETIDISGVAQIVSHEQARAVALAVAWARRRMGAGKTMEDVLAEVGALLERHGLDALDPRRTGDLAAPRLQDVAAALNRLRTLALHGEPS